MKRGTPRNKKTKRLAKALNVPIFAAVGLLEMLWHFTAEQATAGDIGSWTDEEIIDELGWSGVIAGTDIAEQPLIATLVDVGFLDPHPTHRLIVHDWPEHADDGVHLMLARAGKLFADGTVPKVTRLSAKERAACERKLANALEAHLSAHGERTASAHDAHEKRHPSLAKPSLAVPEKLSDAPAPESLQGAEADASGPHTVPLETLFDPESAETTTARARKEQRACRIPADFALTDAMAAAIRNVGCKNPRAAFEHFRNLHTAKGSRFVDWQAAWRTWVGNHGKYACPCQRASPRGLDAVAQVAEEWAAEGRILA